MKERFSSQRRHHLVDFQVTLRRREARFGLLQETPRVAETRLRFLVVTPFDHAALGGLGVARVTHVG